MSLSDVCAVDVDSLIDKQIYSSFFLYCLTKEEVQATSAEREKCQSRDKETCTLFQETAKIALLITYQLAFIYHTLVYFYSVDLINA